MIQGDDDQRSEYQIVENYAYQNREPSRLAVGTATTIARFYLIDKSTRGIHIEDIVAGLESHSTGVSQRRLVLPWMAIPPTPPQTTRLALEAARTKPRQSIVHALHGPVSVEGWIMDFMCLYRRGIE